MVVEARLRSLIGVYQGYHYDMGQQRSRVYGRGELGELIASVRRKREPAKVPHYIPVKERPKYLKGKKKELLAILFKGMEDIEYHMNRKLDIVEDLEDLIIHPKWKATKKASCNLEVQCKEKFYEVAEKLEKIQTEYECGAHDDPIGAIRQVEKEVKAWVKGELEKGRIVV